MAANKFYVRKLTDSFAQFAQGRHLFAGSLYRLVVDAGDFARDTASEASAGVYVDGTCVAECALSPDPLRRGVRVGDLQMPLAGGGVAELHVELGGNTVLRTGVMVTKAPMGAASSVPAPRWTVVDAGVVTGGGPVAVADMTQVKIFAVPSGASLSIVPEDPAGSFDAFLVVTTVGALGFPFGGVTVGGAAPVWRYQDSFTLPRQKWVLHVVKVAGTYCADLYAGRPAGAEVDPDGTVVVSAEVNS